MHLNNVDIFDAAFVLIMAYIGLSRGLLGTIFVIIGVVVSVKFFPKFIESVIHKFADKFPKDYLELIVFALLVLVGYMLGIIVHKIFSGTVRGGLFGVCDRLLGAVLHAGGAASLLWLSVPLALLAVPHSIAQQLHQSILVGWTQKYIPHWLESMPQLVQRDMERTAGAHFSATGQLPKIVETPQSTKHNFVISAAQRDAAQAVVKIISFEPKCKQEIAGTGFYFRFHYIMTNAHVIAGSDSISIYDNAMVSVAIPVYFNPNEDIAILYDSADAGTPLEMAATGDDISDIVAIGYPGGGDLTITPEVFYREENLTSSNIYGQAGINRKVLMLYGGIRHGNSGGPIVQQDGTVVGMVFGAQHHNTLVYSLALSELNKYILRPYGYNAIDTGQCVLV